MKKEDAIHEILTRGVDSVIKKDDLEKKLRSGKKLRIKLGIDPTSPNIHIGRAVALWKLRAFQELGHTAVFIVGDATGVVGDTSDKDAERPMLTHEQVHKNMQTYFDQAFIILDKQKTETHYNSEWLNKLGFIELARMASLFGLHEFSSRELIKKRLDAGKRVSFHELLYPIMQGYDSVAVQADVELGGTDQRFNLLAGRSIQELYHQKPQDVVMTVLLEGVDGRKMSSSWGNVINVTDTPTDMFGKIMSIQDSLIEKYFTLATRVPLPEIKEIIAAHKNPRDQKIILAKEIVALYHDTKSAVEAENNFVNQFSNKELPTDIQEIIVASGEHQLSSLLVVLKLAPSKTEARRLIAQNGVKVNGETAQDEPIKIQKKNDIILQVGKRKFIKIK